MLKRGNTKTRRGEDLDISLGPIHLQGRAKAVISLVNGMVGMLALAAAVVWHANKSDSESTQILEAIWFQTIALATPQEARGELLMKNVEKMPEAVRKKLGDKQ